MRTSQILVNRAAICAALGLSHTQVSDLEKDGVVIKTDNNAYDFVESVNRYIKRLKGLEGNAEGNDYYAERARLTKAQADERELKVMRGRGELVLIETAERVWCNAAITLRNNILALPAKLSKILAPIEEPRKIESELKKELIATLDSVNIDTEDYSE